MSPIARRTVLALVVAALTGCGSANPYQGMSEQELFALAQQKYQDHEWDDATRALERFFVTFGGSELSADARLLQADTYFGKGDFLTARSEYQRFIDRFPSDARAPLAALGMCRSLARMSPVAQRDQQYTNEAITTCRNVVADYGGTPEATEAAGIAARMREKLAEKDYLNADFYYRRKLYDSAIMYYQFVVDGYPETDYAPRALLGIYHTNMVIGYEDLAEEARQQLLDKYPDSPAAAEVRTDGNGQGG